MNNTGVARRRLVLLSLALLGALASCRGRLEPPDTAYLADLEKWRAERLASLKSETSWLTVVGLHWLKPGSNRFGSDKASEIVLQNPAVPARAGTLELRSDGSVIVIGEPGVPLTLNGAPLENRPLASDKAGNPDILAIGSVSFYVIQRADQLAVRVKDRQSKQLKGFNGLTYFPVDMRYRVKGTFEPYANPVEVQVPSAHGPAQAMKAYGLLRFSVRGKEVKLQPFSQTVDDDDFFLVFGDQTAGTETHGSGRFLTAEREAKGSRTVILDFNRATNPPCAFTAYATCPLPPPGNVLPIRIEAGEKAPH
jgi:uncharacterized protein (DUF1684 family)